MWMALSYGKNRDAPWRQNDSGATGWIDKKYGQNDFMMKEKLKSASVLARYGRGVAIAVLVIVFAWSGLHKIIDPASFSLSVFRFHVLPYIVVNSVALWIAGLELACVVGLLIARVRAAVLFTLMGLLIVFSLGIAINLMRGSHMACGCFSTSTMAHPISWLSLLKNAGLMALALYVLSRKDPKPENPPA